MVVVFSIVLLRVSSKTSTKVVLANHVSTTAIPVTTKPSVEAVSRGITISATILALQLARMIPATSLQIFQG